MDGTATMVKKIGVLDLKITTEAWHFPLNLFKKKGMKTMLK